MFRCNSRVHFQPSVDCYPCWYKSHNVVFQIFFCRENVSELYCCKQHFYFEGSSLELFLASRRELAEDVEALEKECLLLSLHTLALHAFEPTNFLGDGSLILVRHLGDKLLFLFGAGRWVSDVALTFELLFDKSLERIEVTAATVAIALWVSLGSKVFDSWVP